MRIQLLLSLAASLAVTTSLSAATFTVVNTNAAGAGSLQQAILDANASAGADVITFNIASVALTITPANALPVITDPVTIDGSTQPGFTGVPIIELNGASAGAAVDGLKIATSNSVIRALVINRFSGDGIEITNGANNTIAGCYLGLSRNGLTDQGNTLNGILITNAANNNIGGLSASDRNHIAGNNQSGVHLGGGLSTNNVLLGNYIGLNLANATGFPNSSDGVRVNAPANLIGGGANGARNVISGNTGQGIEITAQGSETIVRGNYIGTDPAGGLDRGNSQDGILVSGGGGRIGGVNPGEGNLISGNGGDGIELNGISATNIVLVGNIIGGAVLPGGTGVPNSGNGVLITGSARSNIIGGVLAGEANLIAFNYGNGISVAAAAANTNNTFRGNSIFASDDLGINLGAAGITANDASDADIGANQLQNFPVLAAVTNTPGGTIFVGTINSRPNTTYAVDFFSNLMPNPRGSGEGQFYLGATNLTTDAAGLHNFTVLLPVVTVPGRYITATATDNFGNTSEFATNVFAVSTRPGQTFTVVNTNDSGPGSLRQAIIEVNAITAGDRIEFAITNLGKTISVASALPVIADPVVIDGYTQPGAAPNTSPTAFNGAVPVRLSGASAGSGVTGLRLTGGNSTVRGLTITGFANFTGAGMELSSLGGNVVEGCILGLDAAGLDQGNHVAGVLIAGTSNNIIGGVALAARNVISGNNVNGVEISGELARENQVINNLIGTDPTGTLARGNSRKGILISRAGGNTIGGSSAGSGNLISGNGDGIEIFGVSATNNVIWGNRMGTSVNGSDLGNSINGVLLTSRAQHNIIGGILPGQANLIAFNGSAGINVSASASTNNTIRGNSIFANDGLGINLGGEELTVNDPNDVDTGANHLQNFPVLGYAISNSPTEVSLSGSLNSAANRSYTVDFYANTNFDTSWHGEGQFYLGSTNLLTDGSGTVNFEAIFVAPVPGPYLSATATDPYGNTSEFSRWRLIGPPPGTNLMRAADFVFIIDASGSMLQDIIAVKAGLGNFVTGLNTAQIEARFAIVLFGEEPELILDFTADPARAEFILGRINPGSSSAGVHISHYDSEAGLEAIRIVLNSAGNNTLLRNYVGGSGPLLFRPEARKNLIFVTDDNSARPIYVENRQPGQTSPTPPYPLTAPWQAEIDATAQAVITNDAFINLLIQTNISSMSQYGDPAQSVADDNFLNFNSAATLTNLITAGFGNTLEAQVLNAGLVGRAFDINSVNTANFIANFFAAKVEEIVNHPLRPRLNIVPLPPGGVQLTWTTNSPGYLLETNHSLILSNNWGVLTTNYNIIGTNYAVTNQLDDVLRFYRLRR